MKTGNSEQMQMNTHTHTRTRTRLDPHQYKRLEFLR
jgi:hypothetical protein